jgi:hypothetical protein
MPNRIACRKIAGELAAYAADRLPETARDRVDRHLALCACCRREVEDYQQALALMAGAAESRIPASRANWQMLAARMEAAQAQERGGHTARLARQRLIPSLAGAAMLALTALAVNAIWHKNITASPRPNNQKPTHPSVLSTDESFAVTTGKPFAIAPTAAQGPALYAAHIHPPSGATASVQIEYRARRAHATEWPIAKDLSVALLLDSPLTQHAGHSLARRNSRRTQVQQLLALAAGKIDVIEWNGPPRQPDTDRFLAALGAARQAQAMREPSMLRITVQATGRTLLDSQDLYLPTDERGGSWIRRTLLEQPDGDRTVETVAADFSHDNLDSFFSLQTCTPLNRHPYGDLNP